jgi:hypothetical protein
VGVDTKWTDERFDELQERGDPDADAVISAHAALKSDLKGVDLVQDIAHNLRLQENCSDPVREYLEGSPVLPEWADADKLTRGSRFFEDNGLWIGMALFGASLPEGYSAARGAHVLILTGRMVDDVVRRVYETAQMIFDAMATDDGIQPGQAGYDDIRRVRLMHAAVRYLILHDASADCDLREGLPVNQEDLLGTLMTFTQIVFEAMDKMGLDDDIEGREAYLHRWCVVGYLLGIEEDLVRDLTLEDAAEITTVIRRRQRRPSQDGHDLGTALVCALQASVHVGFMRSLPPSLIRWWVGQEVAEINGIEGHTSLEWLFNTSAKVMRAIRLESRQNDPFHFVVRRITAHVGRTTLKAFDNAGRAGNRGHFELPTELHKKVRPLRYWTLRIRPIAPRTTSRRARRRHEAIRNCGRATQSPAPDQ